MLVEISKLEAIRAIGLPAGLFTGIDPRIIAGWRARAAVESPVHLREHPQPTKLVLLCALLHLREREVTDALAQLLISTVHRINARSEEKVITALVKDFKRVTADGAYGTQPPYWTQEQTWLGGFGAPKDPPALPGIPQSAERGSGNEHPL
jgi:hypothetical protein